MTMLLFASKGVPKKKTKRKKKKREIGRLWGGRESNLVCSSAGRAVKDRAVK